MSSTTTFVNPWHPDAIPPIDPSDPRIVHPTGEFGPESYIDTGAWSPAKYPTFAEIEKQFEKKSKRAHKRPPKQGGSGGSKKKRPNLKLDLSKKEGRTQTTLDRWLFQPKRPTRVRFAERVLLKEFTLRTESWTLVPLKGFSEPYSTFSQKRSEVKRRMARQHYWNRQRHTPKTARKVTHILKTMQRENTKLGY